METYFSWSKFKAYLKKTNGLGLDNQILAVAVSGFNRINLSLLNTKFHLITGLKSLDLADFPQFVTVHTSPAVKHNTFSILKDNIPLIQALKPKFLLSYKSTEAIDKLVQTLNLRLLVAGWSLRRQLENKKTFYLLKQKLKLSSVSFKTLTTGQILAKDWNWWLAHKQGRVVLQDADRVLGGGHGTFIIRNQADFAKLPDWLKGKRQILCLDYINGQELAVNGCVLNNGQVVVGEIRQQLVDKAGHYYGNNWDKISTDVYRQVFSQVTQLGQHLYSQGYRGLFGLDMFLDTSGKIYITECNARLTGNLPVSSFLHLWHNLIPIEIIHYLVFLNQDDLINPQAANQAYANNLFYGGHIILKNTTDKSIIVRKSLKPGLYTYRSGSFVWTRPSIGFTPPAPDQVILTDSLVPAGTVLKPGYKIGRLIFSTPILNGKKLSDFALQASQWFIVQLFPNLSTSLSSSLVPQS